MSVSVRKLNADTTFLFDFSAGGSRGLRVLVDPWLAGDSSFLHPSFQYSSHTVTPAVDSLAVLQNEVDIILISQDKPDHCHKETLCSWPKHRSIDIFASSAAAKKIREWKHFDPERVHELPPYNAADQQSIKRVSGPHAGELCIANLTSKKDLTGLHNAIGFTYRPGPSGFFDVSKSPESALNTPPESPTLLRLPPDTPSHPTLRARIRSYSSLRGIARRPRTPIASPPHTPDDQQCVSCIYTPHGVSPSLVQPYLDCHLTGSHALPLTLLVHGTVEERNPWFMGGLVATGALGGVEIIKLLNGKVKHWIAAHDEEKNNKGVSVKLLKTQRFSMIDVEALLCMAGYSHVKLACLDPGEQLRMLS